MINYLDIFLYKINGDMLSGMASNNEACMMELKHA